MLSVSVSSVLDRAAFFLNDVNRSYFTNAVLGDPFKVAYDDLRQHLVTNNISVMDTTSGAIAVDEDMTDIGGPTGPPLPVNFIVPYELWERAAGSTNDYILMERRQFLPKSASVTSYLQYWEYSNQYIKLLGANTDIECKLDYIGDNLNIAEDPEDQINVFNAKSYLAYRTAALAARFLGENKTRADELDADAVRESTDLIITDVKSRQGIYTRRRPFRSSMR